MGTFSRYRNFLHRTLSSALPASMGVLWASSRNSRVPWQAYSTSTPRIKQHASSVSATASTSPSSPLSMYQASYQEWDRNTTASSGMEPGYSMLTARRPYLKLQSLHVKLTAEPMM